MTSRKNKEEVVGKLWLFPFKEQTIQWKEIQTLIQTNTPLNSHTKNTQLNNKL